MYIQRHPPVAPESTEAIQSTPVVKATEQQSVIRPWWGATLAVLPIFAITRFVFLILTYFGGVLFFVPNYWPGQRSFHDVLYMWYHWDVIRFATIATHGYVSSEYAAFFPLYPTLEHAVSGLFHGNVLVAGMVISNVAYLAALVVLYRLVEIEFDSATAQRTALYLSIFPSALFFFAAYNESLFLFFMLLCFYALRRGSWWLAGLCGGLATLTRSIGLLLFVIFLCEFAQQMLPRLRQAWRDRQPLRGFILLTRLPAILLIPLGLGIFAYMLNLRFHNPLAFTHAQVHWREGLSPPWTAPLIAIESIVRLSPFTFAVPHDVIDLTALCLFLVLMVLCFIGPERFARDQWTFALFGLMALTYAVLFPGSPGAGGTPYDPLPSTQRFVLEVFAGFIILARFGRRPWFHQTYLLIALPMLAFLTLQFLTGHWTI